MPSDESVRAKVIFGTSVFVIMLGLYFSSLYSYPLFHGLIEICTIAVAFTLFMLTWNARQYIRNGFLELIGIGYAFIALIDMVHTLSYRGVNLFQGYSANLPTQLWIAARYLQAVTLFAAALLLEKRIRYYTAVTGFALITSVLVGSIFLGWFPDCYIDGQGLTRFKVESEYIIIAILLCSLVMLVRKRALFDADIFRLIAASVLLTAASELAFTAYVSVYGLANLAGHYFKLIAFYLIYRAILVSGITKPFSLIFRKCRQVEEELQAAHDSLAKRVLERTAELEIAMRELEREIAERKLGEKALRESEERYRTLFEHSFDAVLLTIPDGRVLSVNSAACQMFGRTKEEICALGRDALVDTADPRLTKMLEERARMGKVSGELTFIRKDGSRFPGEVSSLVFRDAEGNFRSSMIIRDITERKHAEDTLRESEERYRSLFNNMLNGFAYCRMQFENDEPQDFTFLDVNKAFEELTGLKNVGGRKVSEVIPGIRESDPEMFETYGRVALTGNPEKFEVYVTALRAWFSIFVYCPKKEHFVAVFDVITERKNAEKAIQESERKYKGLVETIVDGVYQSDTNGVFSFINQAGAEIFGYGSSDEMIGRAVIDYWADPEERERFLAEIKNRNTLKSYPIRAKKKDGVEIYLEVSSRIIEDEQGRFIGIEGVLRDVTEKKRLESQLRQSQKMEAIGQLAGGIAHDFNNILSAIIGYGDIMKRKMTSADPQWPHLEQILESAEKAAHLTKSLLAFSRHQVMNPKPADMNAIIRKFERFILRVIGEDIELKTRLADRKLPVLVDTGQIEQALVNLATNARDAMPRGGLLTIETDSETLDDDFIETHGYGIPGEYVVITVADTGIGMNESTRQRIFEPFFTTKELGKGTGLGMSIVYGIIKQHSGYINVYSEPGQGAMFRIYLPLFREAGTEEITPEVSAYPARGTETILVAEDDATLRKLSDSVLREFGYTVILAEDGEDAIEKFKQNSDSINLLVLDMIMPRKNGKEAYEEIKRIRPDIRVLFASGYTADIMHKKGILDDGLEFIMKPLSPMDFLRKVREILDRV